MKTYPFRLLAVFTLLVLGAGLRAQEVWQSVPSPTTQSLWGICYGGGQFVAVGDGGTILTSPNGTTWTKQNSTTTLWLLGVAYSADLKLYAAVGDQGLILTSPDGVTWTTRANTGQRLNGVIYAVDRFIAVGESGTIRGSFNGTNWTSISLAYLDPELIGVYGPAPLGRWLRGLAFARGTWLATGQSGAGPYSVDGTAFTVSDLSSVIDFESVAFGRETFLAVGATGRAETRGPTIGGKRGDPSSRAQRATGTTANLRSVIYSHNTFIVAAADGTIYLTPDGVAGWQRYTTPTTQVLNGLAADDTQFVCVGFGGTILRSSVIVRAPAILTAPLNQTVTAGDNAVLRAAFSGDALSYQWSLNGTPISGATSDTLFVAAVSNASAGTYTLTATNSAGSASASATLTVSATATTVVPPTIVSPGPDLQRATYNNPFTVTAQVVGTGPFTYTWREVSADRTLSSTTNILTTQAGIYGPYSNYFYLTVSGPGGTAKSSAVAVAVNPVAPQIVTSPPASVALQPDHTLFLYPAVNASLPVTFQWYRDGVAIPRMTEVTLTLGARDALPGNYTLVATNPAGTVTTSGTVVTIDPAGRLINLSTRAGIETGDNVLIVGFVIDGPDSKQLLIRGVGGTLAQPQYGLAGVNLANPEITLYDSAGKSINTVLDLPTDPNLGSVLDKASRDTGAFGLGDTRDAAMLVTLPAGLYSVKVSGAGGTSGVGLAEIYEDDKNISRLVNLSARARVSTGASVMIPGLVVGPGTSRKLLIRGAGPALTTYGVSGVLADPRIRLVDADGNTVASNDDWQSGNNPAEVSDAIAKTQAFAFAPGSKDAALVVTLPSGRYSALVEGANGGTGVALVEVYEVK